MRILLDTDLCIAALRRKPAALAWLRQRSPAGLALSAISLFELHQGVGLSTHPGQESERLRAFLRDLEVLPFAGSAVTEAAQLAAHLRIQGRPIGPYDTLIAGHALALGSALATANVREFARAPGLKVVDWSRA
jgi:tRNA(fMet)-specific endonuclease VapC